MSAQNQQKTLTKKKKLPGTLGNHQLTANDARKLDRKISENGSMHVTPEKCIIVKFNGKTIV